MQDTVTSAPEGTVIQITGKVLGRPRQNINMVRGFFISIYIFSYFNP